MKKSWCIKVNGLLVCGSTREQDCGRKWAAMKKYINEHGGIAQLYSGKMLVETYPDPIDFATLNVGEKGGEPC